MSRKERPEEAFPDSLMDAENPDSTEENRGLPTFENDGLPSPEDMEELAKIVQKEARVENSPAYSRAKEKDLKGKSSSAAFKSQQRTMEAMRSFYSEVAGRKRKYGYHERALTDPEALDDDCQKYMEFCTKNGIIPTWNLLAVWLDVDMSTLYAEESLSSKCSVVLKKFRNEIFTILEQSTLQREGNPAAGIFFLKALWGLSDQQPLDVNVHMEGPRQISGRDVQTMIDLTPDEVHDK